MATSCQPSLRSIAKISFTIHHSWKHEVTKVRGATLQIEGRFEDVASERVVDDWESSDGPLPPFKITATAVQKKREIRQHDSPDLPFEY